MSGFLNSIESVAIILLLTATGYFCAAAGWLREESKSFISKFLMMVAVPFMCIYGLKTHLSRDILDSAGIMLLIPFLCISSCFLISYPAAKLLGLPRKTVGVFMMMCGLSNTLFIGYPMCMQLFGEVSIPYVMVYYMVSGTFTQAVGLPLIRYSGESEALSFGMLARFFRSPPFIGIIIGIILVCFDLPVPGLLMTYGKYMNQLVTPLALLVTGEIIHHIGLGNLRMDKNAAVVLGFRFLLAPLLCFLLCRMFGVTGLGSSVFMVQAAMPVVTQTVVAASEYGADESFAAQTAALSTLASFVVIPLLMLFLPAGG